MLTVEDGTGTVPGANSYVSVAEFVAYWTDRSFDYTIYTTPSIERSLIQATDYIEMQYGTMFRGYRLLDDQPLSFPRAGFYMRCVLVEGIPDELKRATFEYAKRVLVLGADGDELLPDPADTDETGAIIKFKFEKIGPIETKVDYLAGSGGQTWQSYPAADLWIERLLYGGGYQSRSIHA